MPYATLDQLTDRFGEQMLVSLTDRAAVATGSIDMDVVDRALADTDAEIDGFLRPRYMLPLAEVPPLIADLALAVAIYKLHRYEPDPKIQKDYELARRSLEGISRGAMRIPAAGIEPETSDGTGARMTDRERPFTETNMKGFI
ncbi:gp436 family protein [Chachezhania antarctica]|uniref:gp436 family protein n=1 Tax=Chachezhania antarctica TaxID=2340860 RepID=UPI000EB2FA80|nr:DUF1320 domain-containing protein [Chachezhania antarctica]|tara:strand:- start:1242 stop:1670 length:429 start_codon:yes stop_codon:yes gene_type:complete